MKLVYFGTSVFAVPALEVLSDSICLVVSQPDRPSGRGLQMHPSPVKARAIELGLMVETPEKCRVSEFVERIKSLEADALLVAAYGQILPQSLLDAAKFGAINLHGSILPKFRGAAPIQRAILEGETETGVTLMQMDKGMDTGDMIAVATLPIDPDQNAGQLQEGLAQLAAQLAQVWMPRVCSGDYPRSPQNNEEATYAPKVEKAEAELRFDRSVREEYNRFRAFTPSPGAYVRTRFGTVRLSSVRPADQGGPPGEVLGTSPELVVGFVDGSLALTEIQPEGKKRMSGRDWANGLRLKAGDRLSL